MFAQKATKLAEAKCLYFLAPHGLTDIELADQLGIDRSSAYRYRKELRAFEVSEGRYTLTPTQDGIDLALAVLQRVHQ